MGNMVQMMQQIAVNAFEASKPTSVVFGTVTKAEPLTILIEQKMEVDESVLVLTDAVKDHYIDIEVSLETIEEKTKHKHVISGSTGSGGTESHSHSVQLTSNDNSTAHKHLVNGIKKVLVKNGLKEGEKVILLRFSGGQQFLVLSRVSERETGGEWK